MGLLTKIFGSPDGGASANGEPQSTLSSTTMPSGTASAASPAAEAALPALPQYTKGDAGNSGIRPAVEAPARAREAARASASNRRPEHPRMYLRPTPASIDPTLPGSTRRQQISVRPSSGKDALSRAPAPPSKRAARAADDAARRESRHLPARNATEGREPAPPGLRLPHARPRPTMVVSPVSLTPEQLALPPGARPKMPTLLGLGAAVGEVLAREGSGSSGPEAVALSSIAAARARAARAREAASTMEDPPSSAARSGLAPIDASAAIGPALALLADFALKLSLGSLAGSWAPAARDAVGALEAVAEQRGQTALGVVLARLRELLPIDSESPMLAGALREQLVNEVTRLAGLLPEWPAPAQDLAEEARRREIRIVRELLLAVDGTRRDQRARLEQQVRLEALASMSAESLAQELAAPVERGTELRRVLDVYLGERTTSAPDVGNRRGLERALERLADAAQAFADADPEQKDEQRVLRAARRDAMTAVSLLLAERGEHEWLDWLEPLSIGERVERLRQWLATADGVEGPAAR